MLTLRRIERLPINFDEFVDEIAEGLSSLYGRRAGEAYRRRAPALVQATINHPAVDAIAAQDGARTAAMLFSVLQRGIGQIPFIHVLDHYAGIGVEGQLVEEAVGFLRAQGAEGITCESVTLCPLELGEIFAALEFERVPRQIMQASLKAPELVDDDSQATQVFGEEDWPEIAEVIVESYGGHADRRLHVEVRDLVGALRFLSSVSKEGYGPTKPEYGRAVHVDGRIAGVIVGCRVAPDVGFVLQVAVRPAHQRQGLGGRLVRELARCFRADRLAQIALGVTVANPAKRLYERLGFSGVHSVNAYAWWSTEEAQPAP